MSRGGGTAPRPARRLAPGIRRASHADAGAISRLIHSLTDRFTIDPDGRGAELFFSTITPPAIAAHTDSMRYLTAEVGGQWGNPITNLHASLLRGMLMAHFPKATAYGSAGQPKIKSCSLKNQLSSHHPLWQFLYST